VALFAIPAGQQETEARSSRRHGTVPAIGGQGGWRQPAIPLGATAGAGRVSPLQLLGPIGRAAQEGGISRECKRVFRGRSLLSRLRRRWRRSNALAETPFPRWVRHRGSNSLWPERATSCRSLAGGFRAYPSGRKGNRASEEARRCSRHRASRGGVGQRIAGGSGRKKKRHGRTCSSECRVVQRTELLVFRGDHLCATDMITNAAVF
jgi:hypothetical protein